MPLTDAPVEHGAKELFRYASVRPPRIIDLRLRATKVSELARVLGTPAAEQVRWAKHYAASDRFIDDVSKLQFDYFEYLKIDKLHPSRLPTRADLADAESFARLAIRRDERYQADCRNGLLSVAAERLANGKATLIDANVVARLFDFVESFPDLHRTSEALAYAQPVLERARLPQSTRRVVVIPELQRVVLERANQLKNLTDGLATLWQARNRRVQERKAAFDKAVRDASRPQLFDALPPAVDVAPTFVQPGGARREGRATPAADGAAGARKYSIALRNRAATLRSLKEQYQASRSHDGLEAMLDGNARDIARYAPGKSSDDISRIVTHVKDWLSKEDISPTRFCQAYEQAVAKSDAAGVAPATGTATPATCFVDGPVLTFADTVRHLGRADLIRVEETFVKYSYGEISYIETILAGEVRKRRVKSTRYSEATTERATEEASDATKESSVSTQQELHNQIETELKTRLDSDINASANASGGGKLYGVIDVQGGGNVTANMGVGLDTSLKANNESKLAQEIVDKAVEKTRKTILEKRASKSYSLDEMLNYHEINNTDGDHRNGIYCFLNRHVAITETVFGQRLFLLANLSLPGRSLLCERVTQMQMTLEQLGQKPVFDVTPEDITPANYLSLAGRFKAHNVQPPPAPVITLARTWKTDTTNTSSEAPEFNAQQVAKVLMPLFAQYKRYMIAENVKLPDGYEVMDVAVTVNHGANGMSIPADLPLRLAGAFFGAGPIAAYYLFIPIYIPIYFWMLSYLASPALHFNADSANVTVNVGNDSQDSPYYFFAPDFLVQEVFNLLGVISAAAPGMIAEIERQAGELNTQLTRKAAALPPEIKTAVENTVASVIGSVQKAFNKLTSTPPDFSGAFTAVNGLVANLDTARIDTAMADLFGPLKTFIQNVIDAFDAAVGSALADFFTFLSTMFENSQTLPFHNSMGYRGELPVSINAVSIKPGITINMTACLRRTQEALDKWRLETFSTFHQSHLQLLAEYEAKTYMADKADRMTKPPQMLRDEEHAAIKERVLQALNNLHDSPGPTFTFERMNLFEHAIDWANMQYRVFNYGPTYDQVRLDKLGAFSSADARRRAFMTSVWAQVLIPVQDNPHLEDQMSQYLESGTFNMEGGLNEEELVALYRDLILQRNAPDPPPSPPKFAVLPTDFIALKTDDELPRNPAFPNA